MNVGIIGHGTVGAAFADALDIGSDCGIYVNDINAGRITRPPMPIMEMQQHCDIVFICVPTPTNDDVDISIVESVVEKLSDRPVVCLRSTVPPGTTTHLSEKHDVDILYHPEFMTEAGGSRDILNASRLVLAGHEGDRSVVKKLYGSWSCPIFEFDDPAVGEMIKYASNTFLATKVSFANQMKLVCDHVGIDVSDVMDVVVTDERIAASHLDPTMGAYGGMCLPKDVRGLLAHARDNDINLALLEAVQDINEELS